MGIKMLTGDVREIAKTLLKQEWNLSDFEALQIAVKIQQNQVLADAFGVSDSNKHPTFLEAISIALGYSREFGGAQCTTSAAIEYGMDKLCETLTELKKQED